MEDNIVLKLLNLLEQLVDERGVPKSKDIVDKNIIPVDNTTLATGKTQKSKATITTNERKKLVETFTLFNKMFFDYKKNIEGDKAEKTLVSKISSDQKKTTPITKSEGQKKESGGLLSTLFKWLVGGTGLMALVGSVALAVTGFGLLAASLIGLGAALSGVFGNMTGAVKVVGKLGFAGALKMMAGSFVKRFALGVLKKLPIIGGIIGLAFAVKAFKDGDIPLGISELVSGLLNFIPIAGPFLSMGADILIAFAQAKGMFSTGGALSTANGGSTVKGWVSSIGKFMWDNALDIPILGTFKYFGMAKESIANGKWGEGLTNIGYGIVSLIPGGGLLVRGVELLAGWLGSKAEEGAFSPATDWMGSMKAWIKTKLKNLPAVLREPLKWFGIIDGDNAPLPTPPYAGESKTITDKYVKHIKDVHSTTDKTLEDSSKLIKDTSEMLDLEDTKAKLYREGELSAEVRHQQATRGALDKLRDLDKKYLQQLKDKIARDRGLVAEDLNTNTQDNLKKSILDKKDGGIPNIMEMLSGAMGGLSTGVMSMVNGLSDTLGNWVSNAIVANSESVKDNDDQSNKENSQVQPKESPTILLPPANNNGVKLLYEATTQQNNMIMQLVNIGTASLKELKRMNGSASSSTAQSVPSRNNIPANNYIPIQDNRDGFSGSVYSLA